MAIRISCGAYMWVRFDDDTEIDVWNLMDWCNMRDELGWP